MPAADETRTYGYRPRAEAARFTRGRRVLGRYRITGELAVGGSARVVRARDERLGRDVAVKLLHPHLVRDPDWRERIGSEARAVAELSHPGIADVYDVDLESATPALVMELVEGDSLAEVIERRGHLPARQVAVIGAQVADALYLAHRRGFIHRDVKPGNIILERRSGRARLVDFGIAQSLARTAEELTATGTTIGTLRYMSPEQLNGEPITPRTDLWSLGVVMYQALTGSVPYPGPSPVAIARQQAEAPPPMHTGNAGLERVILSCLQVRVDDRPRHAGALAEMLRTAPLAAPVPRPASTRSWRRRGVAALTLAGMVVLGFLLVVGGDSDQLVGPAPASVTPSVSPLQPLLADYAGACGEPLDREQIVGLSRADAESWLIDAIAGCQATPTPDQAAPDGGGSGSNAGGNGNGRGRGNGGGNGHGHGEGNG